MNNKFKFSFAVFLVFLLGFSVVLAKSDNGNSGGGNSGSSSSHSNSHSSDKSNNGNAYGKSDDKTNNGKHLGQLKKGLNTVTGLVTEVPVLLKSFLHLVADKIVVLRGEVVKIGATLSDENNAPVSDKEVTFYVNKQKLATEITDQQGLAYVNWDTAEKAPGVYLVKVDFQGDANYQASSDADQITVLAPNATTNETSDDIKKIEQCEDVPYTDVESVFEPCTIQRTNTVCDAEMNKTCHTETVDSTEQCFTGKKTVQKTNRVCTTVGYVIFGKEIRTEGYVCSIEEKGNKVTLICDSRYDGDGNGACSPGESCMRFVVTRESSEKAERNSHDQYLDFDDSYFLKRASIKDIGSAK